MADGLDRGGAVVEAAFLGLALGDAGLAHLEVHDSEDACTDGPVEVDLLAQHGVRGEAALLVGGGAEGDIVQPARDGVIEGGAVAGSIDVGDICLHGVGDDDGAVFELFEPGVREHIRVRADADGEHDHIHVVGAQRRDDAPGDSALALYAADGLAEVELHAVLAEVILQGLLEELVVAAHDVGHGLEEQGLSAAQGDGLSHFHADEAAADYGDALGLVLEEGGLDGLGLGDSLEDVDALELPALNGRDDGAAAGCDEELIVALDELLAGLEVFDVHGFCIEVHGGDLVPEAEVHAAGAELLRRADLDELDVVVDAADIIGQAAGAVRDDIRLFKDDDLRVFFLSCDARGGTHARRVSADNDNCHLYSPNLYFNSGRAACTAPKKRSWGGCPRAPAPVSAARWTGGTQSSSQPMMVAPFSSSLSQTRWTGAS